MSGGPAVFAEDALTRDAFLGGRLVLQQPRSGYRAGVDPVLLAASVAARAGQSVLDLGCGAGAAALCLAVRVPGLALTGVERQPAYAALARANAAAAAIPFDVVEADLRALPPPLRGRSFDHVIANPPYFDPAARRAAADPGREAAQADTGALADWVAVAARRLKPRGQLHLVCRVERVPELLAAAERHLGSVELLPLAPRAGRAAQLVLVRARKAGRAPFRLHPPFLLHAGARHMADGDDYTAEVRAILRDGAALPWP